MSARVLVVDDIQANRRLMQAKLEAKYYTVLLAENGLEALEIAVAEAPQIILLDVMMPGMDGYEVCERLKQDDRTRHIPVVMLTALNDREDRLRGLEAGADDFLSKPIDDFALMARLEALTRYNAVANELRQREATSNHQLSLSDEEVAEAQRPANILLIDKDSFDARRLASSLEAAGHSVRNWTDKTPSSQQSGKLDLIVMALSNQDYDPLKLCARLRSMDETRDVAIIVTCEINDRELAAKALSLGAGDVIVAPVDPQELIVRVRTQLRRTRYVEILRRRLDRGLELSVIDQLTGLYNRRYMLGQLQQWMQRASVGGKPLSIISFDIDHFKRINDTHGHEAGDIVLKEFAARIRTNVRPKDIVCRPGGEEFLVVLPETPGDLACLSAERIRHAIAADPFEIERIQIGIDVTVSAGVATYSLNDGTLADLLHRADTALYRAKEGGRNRVESIAA
jgi:two-component system cell cycle response regulator